jgi:hypothetical protein
MSYLLAGPVHVHFAAPLFLPSLPPTLGALPLVVAIPPAEKPLPGSGSSPQLCLVSAWAGWPLTLCMPRQWQEDMVVPLGW